MHWSRREEVRRGENFIAVREGQRTERMSPHVSLRTDFQEAGAGAGAGRVDLDASGRAGSRVWLGDAEYVGSNLPEDKDAGRIVQKKMDADSGRIHQEGDGGARERDEGEDEDAETRMGMRNGDGAQDRYLYRMAPRMDAVERGGHKGGRGKSKDGGRKGRTWMGIGADGDRNGDGDGDENDSSGSGGLRVGSRVGSHARWRRRRSRANTHACKQEGRKFMGTRPEADISVDWEGQQERKDDGTKERDEKMRRRGKQRRGAQPDWRLREVALERAWRWAEDEASMNGRWVEARRRDATMGTGAATRWQAQERVCADKRARAAGRSRGPTRPEGERGLGRADETKRAATVRAAKGRAGGCGVTFSREPRLFNPGFYVRRRRPKVFSRVPARLSAPSSRFLNYGWYPRRRDSPASGE
ncbi:hypothetical protein DFH09DRAFT_1089056 [Mycena vulgaris]|nr:hypothetical protein DFH09DRAFT_1089056 [Mycena vulgaris]